MRKLLWLFLAALPVAGAVAFISGDQFELIALGRIQVRSELGPGTTTTDKLMGEMAPGQNATIIKCHDLKHYIVPEVKLANGQTGYVYSGEYRVIKAKHSLCLIFYSVDFMVALQ